jgi:hypothetical protein
VLQRETVPALDHVLALTDDVGIIQHARESIPNRSTGYCTDDVARALIVANERLRRYEDDGEAMRIAGVYLAYLYDAQIPDGRFRNFMSYARTWLDEVGTHDSVGRAMWALGHAVRYAPRASWRRVAAEMLDRALAAVEWLAFPRSRAYAILGLAHAVKAEASSPRLQALGALARTLNATYENARSAEWPWYEEVMTYDNARLPEAMLRAGEALDDPELVAAGAASLEFLERVVFEDGIFVPIGNDGWYRRGGERARFAQQPLEASAMVDVELAAFDVLGGTEHRAAAPRAAAWYTGKNSLGISMAHAGGCYDGLSVHGPNRNMGAESTLAYLAAAYAVE